MSTTQPEIFSWTNQPETWDQNINYEILKRTRPEAISSTYYANDYPNFQRFMKNWQDTSTHPPDLVILEDTNTWNNGTNYEILKRTRPEAISSTYFANDYPNFQRFMKNWQDTSTHPPDLIKFPLPEEEPEPEPEVEPEPEPEAEPDLEPETEPEPEAEPYCPPIPVYVEPTIIAEALQPSTYNTISSRWLLTTNGDEDNDTNYNLKEIIVPEQANKINPFENLEFWDNDTDSAKTRNVDILISSTQVSNRSIDFSTNESWINQPNIIIPPWEIFFAGNENKVVPTQNTLDYSLDIFNKKVLLFNENSIFLGSNTPPKTMTCWISINNSNYDTVIIGESNINKWSSTLSLKTGNIDSLMNRLFIEIVNNDATRTITKYSKRAVITNTYHHIALVYYSQEQRDYLELYTDGFFDFTIDVTDFQLNTDRFTIGGQQSNRYNRYQTQGDVINLTIWNTRMSPENILYLAEINDKTSNGD